MNHWARMLAQVPASLQQAIARRNRISLPRSCSPDERLLRLRRALCRQAGVRATYQALTPDEQAALQALRHMPRGLRPAELQARFGPIRAPAALRADPTPQSLSERLLLLGWLLPRPAAPRNPPRYLLPPELRRWLPQPPHFAPHGAPPPATPPPALCPGRRAAAAFSDPGRAIAQWATASAARGGRPGAGTDGATSPATGI